MTTRNKLLYKQRRKGSFGMLSLLLLGLANATPTWTTFGYTCPATCQLPTCRCASEEPPVPVEQAPQFVLITFDDTVDQSIMPQSLALFSDRVNPNGCAAHATFYAQAQYTDPNVLNEWYAAGNEVGDHSATHSQPAANSFEEINGMLEWAAKNTNITKSAITGVRFPFRVFSKEALERLPSMGIEYDSSIAATEQEMTWPYTLDYGVATECWGSIGLCGKGVSAPGLWEIPMYHVLPLEAGGIPALMDPFNDPSILDPTPPEKVTAQYLSTFQKHYNGNKAPVGVYTHPVWLGKGNPPAIPDGTAKLAAVNAFLDEVTQMPDVWIVTGQQLVEYMKNPVPASQLGIQPYMSCDVKKPYVRPSKKDIPKVEKETADPTQEEAPRKTGGSTTTDLASTARRSDYGFVAILGALGFLTM